MTVSLIFFILVIGSSILSIDGTSGWDGPTQTIGDPNGGESFYYRKMCSMMIQQPITYATNYHQQKAVAIKYKMGTTDPSTYTIRVMHYRPIGTNADGLTEYIVVHTMDIPTSAILNPYERLSGNCILDNGGWLLRDGDVMGFCQPLDRLVGVWMDIYHAAYPASIFFDYQDFKIGNTVTPSILDYQFLFTFAFQVEIVSSTTLTACPAGTYCPVNATTPTSCVAGTFCPFGTIVPQPCPGGSWCGPGVATPTICEAAYYCPALSTSVSSQQLCTTGSYCPANSTLPTGCPAGYRCPQGSATPIKCDAGTFCEAGVDVATNCAGGTFCPAGSGTPQPCPAGSWCGRSSAAPTPCSPKYFCPALSSSQQLCTNGWYCPGNSTTPIPCGPGYSCPAGSSVQTQCPVGTFCGAGSSYPTPCTPGRLCKPGSTNDTIICPDGQYCPNNSGLSASSECDPGCYCPAGSAEPTPCPSGYICNSKSLGTPVPCPSNTYSHRNDHMSAWMECVPCHTPWLASTEGSGNCSLTPTSIALICVGILIFITCTILTLRWCKRKAAERQILESRQAKEIELARSSPQVHQRHQPRERALEGRIPPARLAQASVAPTFAQLLHQEQTDIHLLVNLPPSRPRPQRKVIGTPMTVVEVESAGFPPAPEGWMYVRDPIFGAQLTVAIAGVIAPLDVEQISPVSPAAIGEPAAEALLSAVIIHPSITEQAGAGAEATVQIEGEPDEGRVASDLVAVNLEMLEQDHAVPVICSASEQN